MPSDRYESVWVKYNHKKHSLGIFMPFFYVQSNYPLFVPDSILASTFSFEFQLQLPVEMLSLVFFV